MCILQVSSTYIAIFFTKPAKVSWKWALSPEIGTDEVGELIKLKRFLPKSP